MSIQAEHNDFFSFYRCVINFWQWMYKPLNGCLFRKRSAKFHVQRCLTCISSVSHNYHMLFWRQGTLKHFTTWSLFKVSTALGAFLRRLFSYIVFRGFLHEYFIGLISLAENVCRVLLVFVGEKIIITSLSIACYIALYAW